MLATASWLTLDSNKYIFKEAGSVKGQYNVKKNKFEGIIRKTSKMTLIDGIRQNDTWQGLARTICLRQKQYIIGEREGK